MGRGAGAGDLTLPRLNSNRSNCRSSGQSSAQGRSDFLGTG